MKAVPTKKQLAFMDWEFGVFFHFGIRTFYEGYRDWDGKEMHPEAFQPLQLDCRQWIRTAKEAGATYAILTAKHHDGFANWPTQYSPYSVAATAWKQGKGDVVREFVDACREYGIKIGLYYSPAEHNMKARAAKEYDDYFINQVSELLTWYGEIHYLWFDGNGSQGHTYDAKRIVKEIRALQPDILLFGLWDPDVRWVGNEAGYAPETNYNTETAIDFSPIADRAQWFNVPAFIPAECDCMMRRHNWFYSDADVHTVKQLDELMGIYYGSVGRGANLLINIGPDRRGLLPEPDAQSLLDMGNEIRRRFSAPLAECASPQPGQGGYELRLREPTLINHIVLEEDLTEGEAIKGFTIKVVTIPSAMACTIYRGTSVGHKKICCFPAAYVERVQVEVTDAFGEVKLAGIKAYYI